MSDFFGQLTALIGLLLLAGCTNVHPGRAYCTSINEHYIGSPEDIHVAGDCNATFIFDWPVGRKLAGEK